MRERPSGQKRNAQLARQTVARAGRNDSYGRLAERHSPSHLVDRAIAAPRDDKLRAGTHRVPRQLVSVSCRLRQENFGAQTHGVQRVGGEPDALLGRSAARRAGHRVDDDEGERAA